MLSLGIVGLPNAGKSSLFKALTRISVPIANYPFTTIEPHHGVVAVPDERLEKLSKLTPENQIIHTTLEFVDIAGLIEGAHKGEGLGNQFLSHIREVDGIIEVVRLFEDKTVPHPIQDVNPERDIEIINSELIQADLKTLERLLQQYIGAAKTGDKSALETQIFIQKAIEILKNNILLRDGNFGDEERVRFREFNLLTAKPIIFLWNINELDSDNRKFPKRAGIAIPLKLFADFADVPEAELAALKKEFGINENLLADLIRKAYDAIDVITFFTVKPPETRAWTIKKNTILAEAGAVIHADFKEKFIRAEVINIDELLNFSSWHDAKAAGKVRTEGKDYVVQDGDVIEFKI